MSFNDFVHKYKLKNKAKSNMTFHQRVSSLFLNDVGIYFKDGPFFCDIGVVNLHQSKGAHWVCYNNENYFERYGCSPPRKISKIVEELKAHSLYSEYKN